VLQDVRCLDLLDDYPLVVHERLVGDDSRTERVVVVAHARTALRRQSGAPGGQGGHPARSDTSSIETG